MEAKDRDANLAKDREASAEYSVAATILFMSWCKRVSSGGRRSCNCRSQINDALLKNDVAVAVLIAQAAAWCDFLNTSSALRSSDLSPAKESVDSTDEEANAATGASTDGRANRSSSSGAAQYNFLS